ncbi:MAG TPA: sensor domain-containing diguanylate cyclase [Myxococcaceae bacterium]|nr:sensor domain-containing diguanylate cyclase [Myxococcaceae bacterium]
MILRGGRSFGIPGFSALMSVGGVGLTLWLLARGAFGDVGELGLVHAGAVVLLWASLWTVLVRRVRRERAGAPGRIMDEIELGASVLSLSHVLIAVMGPALHPILYLVMAFLVSFMHRRAGLALLGLALVFEVVTTLLPSDRSLTEFALHTIFLGLFAALYQLVLQGRMLAARRAESDAVKNRVKEAEERARTFRLVSSGSREDAGRTAEEQEKWLLASVAEVEGALSAAMEIAEVALQTHTCGVFLLTSDDAHLRLHDCRTQSDAIQRQSVPAGEGLLGGVLKRNVPIRMHSAKGLKGINWYERGGPEVQSILAVPIVEPGGLVRGVLVADRLTPEGFSDNDERLLSMVGQSVLRAIEVERVMTYIRKSRDEKGRFFRAIQELNSAGNPEQVFRAVIDSTLQMAGLDFCAVTIASEEEGKRFHRVVRTSEEAKALEGRVFDDNAGLVSTVVRYGTPLPGRELRNMERQVIFDEKTQLRGLSALKIFPLQAGDRIMGTLVAGSREKPSLDEDTLRMIEVIAIQAAQAILRAQLFAQMETMATTDGLTGLVNHRTFQLRADELIAQARRYGRKCSIILTDIDHFKSVNDTYGHPTGDAVLRGVARLLRQQARDTDVVARYGGEEFCLVMPETDTEGARVIAERIREAVGAETFQTDMGPLKVTLSLGIATCADDSTEKQVLIDLADQCLYFAKRNGRNQTVTVAQMQAGNRAAKLRAVS